jgi:hypothetical protein
MMKWTTKRPTLPGLYWITYPQVIEPQIVWVTDAFGTDLVVEEHGLDWEEMLKLVDYEPNARWYGPITPPSRTTDRY